jgi:hypothetical protein
MASPKSSTVLTGCSRSGTDAAPITASDVSRFESLGWRFGLFTAALIGILVTQGAGPLDAGVANAKLVALCQREKAIGRRGSS